MMGDAHLLNTTQALSSDVRSSNTLSEAFGTLPILELASVCINLALFILFFFVDLVKRISVFVGRLGFVKDDESGSNASPIRRSADGEIHDVDVGASFKMSVSCCFYVLFVQVLVLGFDVISSIRESVKGKEVEDWSVVCWPAAQVLAWFLLSSLALHCKFKAFEKFPLLLRVWWLLSFVICLCAFYVDGRELFLQGQNYLSSHVVANFAVTPALAFLSFIAVRGVTGIKVYRNPDLQEPLLLEEEPGCLKVTPYSEAGLFSLITLSWLNPLLSIGAKRPLELKDIPLLAPKDRSKNNYKILNSNWEKLKAENPSKQPSLAWAILKSFWKEAACNAIFAGLNTLVSYVGPYMISYFVDYLGGKETFPHEGYILAGTFFFAKLVETLTARQWYLGVDILGMHVRSALTALVYRKGLRLSSSAKQSHTSGEIVNYMAVDVQRVGDYSWYLHDAWMLPMQIILALAILYKNVGIASIATLIATIVSIIVTIPIARIQEDYQDKLMAAKDDRMRKTSECLRSMRILKLQAWEVRYKVKLEEMRGVEFKWLRKALYSQAFITFIFWSSPIFVSVVTFATCILLGGQLTAGSVLSALATFRILQEPLRNFPDLVSMMAQTKVSLDRISGLLLEEELREDATINLPRGTPNAAVEIKDGLFSWDISSPRPTLSGIQVRVEKGMRVAICGVVGSGKSSFLSCILGEIPKIMGEVRLCGTSAYVPQSPWIQSGNIEENILFGSPLDKPKYKNAIHACSLKKDLENLPHGDQTIIGDRGINLSGGQKQRVQLARALYQDADIYLLDDPFSAVDIHTALDLFKEYIMTALADKTVIFVTHQVEFLPAVDLILVIKEGRIIQAGKYDDLLQAGTDFNTLVTAHHEAIEAMDIPNHSSDSDETMSADESSNLSKKCDLVGNNIGNLPKEVQECITAAEQKAIKEKKKAKRSRKRQLVQEEERVRGRVSMKVYLSYMAAAYTDLLLLLVLNISRFEFEARKDVVQIFNNLLRRQIGSRWPTVEYLSGKPDVIFAALAGYENEEVALNTGMVLKEMLRHEQLCKILLYSDEFYKYPHYIETTTFGISCDAFANLKETLTRHKPMVAEYLDKNYDRFFSSFTTLILSNNYVTKRQSLKLLGEILLDRANFNVMTRYIANEANLKMMMNLLRDKSKNIQFEAFHVFKVFVANPKKPPQIESILRRNKEKLLNFLKSFHNDKEDEQFSDEKQFLIVQIQNL